MTLNGRYALYCRNNAWFRANHKNLNEAIYQLSYWKRLSASLSVCRHNWEPLHSQVPACIWQYSQAIFIVNNSGSMHCEGSEAVASELKKIFWMVNIRHTRRDIRQPETLDKCQRQRRRPCVWRRYFCVLVGSRALSFKRPLLSLGVDVCLFVCLSATLRSNISETKGARG